MQAKEEVKSEQIRASVQFPFHSLSGNGGQSKPVTETPVTVFKVPPAAVASPVKDDTVLQDDLDVKESRNGDFGTAKEDDEDDNDNDNNFAVSASEIDKDEPMSLSDLSSSFQQCFHSVNRNRKAREEDKSEESKQSIGLQLKPFDYEAARKEVIFGEKSKELGVGERSLHDSKAKKKSDKVCIPKDDEAGEFAQGRRRKAFPATGNRSATFR